MKKEKKKKKTVRTAHDGTNPPFSPCNRVSFRHPLFGLEDGKMEDSKVGESENEETGCQFEE